MQALLDSIKALRPWQIGVLVVALLGSGAFTYGMYARATSADQVELTQNQQLIPIQYGDLMNQVTTSGSLTFPEREILTFGSAGTVSEVLVKVGQRVEQGERLALLDGVTIASLEKGVAQARVDLKNAEETLADLQESYTALELAQAEESVSNARLQLETAQEALEDARTPYTKQEIKSQEQSVASARLSLKNAEEAIANLVPGNTLKFAEARQSQADAEAALEDAREALAQLTPSHIRDLAAARQARADAQIAYDNAVKALENFEADNNRQVDDLRNSLTDAQQAVEDAIGEYNALVKLKNSGSLGLDELIRRRQESVESRQEELDKVETQIAELLQLEAKVVVAEEALKQAVEDLERLTQGPDSLERQKLEAAVDVAVANLKVANDALAKLTADVDPLELALSEADLALAQATLDQAETDLAEMLLGPDPLELVLKEKQVTLAEATLADAEEALAELLEGNNPLDLALSEAEVGTARQALENALQLREDATMMAPFDGLVVQVDVEAGDEVQASTTVVELVDPTVMEIDGIVDEIDVLMVQEGTRAQITMDALPGETFAGVVSEIAPAAQSQQGVVTYPIRIQVQIPEGFQAREGLSAVANIVLREEKDVLLVPQQSLYGSIDAPVVKVMTSGGVEERPVVLGNSDDFWVAVRDGLNEGDQVILESEEVSTGQFSFRDLRRTTGGGFGGGGRGRGR